MRKAVITNLTPQVNNPPIFDPGQVTEFDDFLNDRPPFRELFLACKNGTIAEVEQHFRHWWQCMCNILLNAQREQLISGGHHDMGNSLLPKIKQLREQNVESHPISAFKFNPFHVAAAYGKLDVLEKLIQLTTQRSGKKRDNVKMAYGLSITHPLELPRVTALDFACKYNHQQIIIRLLKDEADPRTTKPIKRIAKNQAGETIVTIDNLNSKTPLMWCVEHNMDTTLVNALLRPLNSVSKKEYLDHRCTPQGPTALEMAIVDNNVPLVRTLLINGASCNLPTPQANGEASQLPLSLSLALAQNANSSAERDVQRDITQLLLIFGAVMPQPIQQLMAIHPHLNLKTPGYFICKAAVRLIDRAEACCLQGNIEPMAFLQRLLNFLPKECALVEQVVLKEMSKEDNGWFNTKNKTALNPKSFSHYLLQELSQEPGLLTSLNMGSEEYSQFSRHESVRTAFQNRIVHQLYTYIKGGNTRMVNTTQESEKPSRNDNFLIMQLRK